MRVEAIATTGFVESWLERDGALLRLRLARPKANLVDAAMIAALHGAFAEYGRAELRAVLLDAKGPHFSFGASVEEHLPDRCAAMLASLHALILAMLQFPAPILVAVRGQCLGGGLEVALAGGPIFATPDAQLGQPEMKLGVFAPAASCLLPYRVNQPAAEDLLFSGRSISGEEAKAIGLVQVTAVGPRSGRAGLLRRASRAEERRRPRLRRDCGARIARRRRPAAPCRARTPLSRHADEDARCQRRTRRVPRQASSRNGSIADDHVPPVIQIVERCQALFEDLELNAVKQWKAAVPGRKAIGYMPIYVPRELVHAAGMLSVGILGGGDQIEVIQGDAYYQSYICRIPRSTIELALTGRLDCLDGMLFPSICDVIRNLSGMWQILFKDKYVRYFDVPQNYEDAIGGTFYINELQALRDDLGKLRGAPITDEELNASIRVYNANRRAVQDLYAYRAKNPWQAPTSEVYLVLRAGMVLPPEEHTQLVRDYIAAAEALPRPKRDNARVVLNGSFCEQPPLGLIKSIEMAGCYIVDDDFMLVTRWLLDDVPAKRQSTRGALEGVPAPLGNHRGEIRREARGQGRFPPQADQDQRRGGRDFRGSFVLRPGAARASDAAGRALQA